MAREQTTVRLPGDLLAAAKSWTDSADIRFTRLIEDSLRDRVGGWAPESTEYRLEDLPSPGRAARA